MTLGKFEEQVVLLEERAGALTLVGFTHIELEEINELWNTAKALSQRADMYTCAQGRRLSERLGSAMAELACLKMRLAGRPHSQAPAA